MHHGIYEIPPFRGDVCRDCGGWKLLRWKLRYKRHDGYWKQRAARIAKFRGRLDICLPRSLVSPTWSLRNGWVQKLGQVMCQLLGSRPSGTGVGCGSAEGASNLNFSTCRRDKASLLRLMQLAICLAWNKILYLSVERTKCLSRTMIERSLEVCLLIISTTAWLSEKKTIHLLRISGPPMSIARTIGKNSKIVVWNVFQTAGHSPKTSAFQISRHKQENPPRP